MPVAQALATFKSNVAQCDSLIGNAHQADATGAPILPQIDREQITVAAFLNMFIAWEALLEALLSELLSGAAPIVGGPPVKFASPLNADMARKMIIGTMRYFDYGNHFNFKKVATIYFEQGGPFQPHLDAINGNLEDLRVMRNASAHISSSTQTGLEALALRLLASPSSGIRLYTLLTANDPKSTTGATIFQTHRDVLLATAELIANG